MYLSIYPSIHHSSTYLSVAYLSVCLPLGVGGLCICADSLMETTFRFSDRPKFLHVVVPYLADLALTSGRFSVFEEIVSLFVNAYRRISDPDNKLNLREIPDAFFKVCCFCLFCALFLLCDSLRFCDPLLMRE